MKKINKYCRKSFEIIKKNKKSIFFLIILYIVILIIGSSYYGIVYETPFSSNESQNSFNDWWKTMMLRNTFHANLIYIFLHNTLACAFRIISGIIFAIIPIGSVIRAAWGDSYSAISSFIEIGFMGWFWRFVPHAIFEIPAFIISSSLGVSVFISILKKKKRLTNLKDSLKDALTVFLLVILPLLFVAAVIESLEIMIFNFW